MRCTVNETNPCDHINRSLVKCKLRQTRPNAFYTSSWHKSGLQLMLLVGPHFLRNTPFLRQMGRLTALTASLKVPDSLATVLTCGGLLALYKESPKEQAEWRNRGEDPKIRSVNIGCCLLKWAFKLTLLSKPAQQAAIYIYTHRESAICTHKSLRTIYIP